MKPNAHPEYMPVTVTCACGMSYKTRSARLGDFNLDICSNCHPFFTGKVKLMDTEGRVERFRNKYKAQEGAAAKKAEKKEAKPAEASASGPSGAKPAEAKAEKAEKKSKKEDKKQEPSA